MLLIKGIYQLCKRYSIFGFWSYFNKFIWIFCIAIISKEASAFSPGSNSNFEYSLTDTSQIPAASTANIHFTKGVSRVSNGAFEYSIPIYLPPTTNNIAPQINFAYSSIYSKDSNFGVGWQLTDIGAITRCPAIYATETSQAEKPNAAYSQGDRLCLNGQKLILKNGAANASDADYWAANAEYRTEIETFQKVVANNNHTQFTVYLKNGLIQTYGDSQSQNSVYYRPGYIGGAIKQWGLAKTVDRYGNSYKVIYGYDTNDNEQYIKEIQIDPNVAVTFEYINRTHPRFGYDAGKKYVQRKILQSILVRKKQLNTGAYLESLREYKMTYEPVVNASDRMRMAQLHECGFKGSSSQPISVCAKPLVFGWNSTTLLPSTGNHVGEMNPIKSGEFYSDVNFDGYFDLVGDGYVTIKQPWGDTKLMTGSSAKEPLVSMQLKRGFGLIRVEATKLTNNYYDYKLRLTSYEQRSANDFSSTSIILKSGVNAYLPKVLVGDFNNDGLDDLCAAETLYLQSIDTGQLSASGIATSGCKFHNALLLDINSDGLNDVINLQYTATIATSFSGEGSVVTQLNSGQGFSNAIDPTFNSWSGQFIDPTPKPGESNVFPQTQVTLLDLNGDGNKDLVYVKSLKLAYRLNTGRGLTAEVITSHVAGVGGGFGSDVNGDGLEDYVAASNSNDGQNGMLRAYLSVIENEQLVLKQSYFANITGAQALEKDQGWCHYTYRKACAYLAARAFNQSLAIGDDTYAPVALGEELFFLRGTEYNLLASVQDGLSNSIRVNYGSAKVKLDGDNSSFNLPTNTVGAVQTAKLYEPTEVSYPYTQVPASQILVSQIVQDGHYRFYSYTGGKQSTTGRGFMGFRYLREFRQTKEKVIVKHEFKQDFPFTGLPQKTEIKDLYESNIFQKNEYAYTKHPQNAQFIYKYKEFRQQYSHLSDQNTGSTVPKSALERTFEYDRYGNLEKTRSINGIDGYLNYSSSVTGMLRPLREAITTNTFEINEADHLLGFLSRTRTDSYHASGGDFRTVCQSYYSEPNTLDVRLSFNNCDWYPYTEQVALQTIFTRNSKGIVTEIQATGYDSGGFPTRTLRFENFENDIYPRQIINNLGDITSVEYDQRHSDVKKVTDANNFTTEFKYDPWGRPTETWDRVTDNKTINDIALCTSTTCPTLAKYSTSQRTTNSSLTNQLAGPLQTQYFDSFGREIRQQSLTLGGTVKVDTQYNHAGHVANVSEPFTGTAPVYWTTYSYDDLGRLKSKVGVGVSTYYDFSADVGTGLLTTTETVINSTPGGTKTLFNKKLVNALGQMVQSSNNLANIVDYSYNSQGNLETTIVNNNPATKITVFHDHMGYKKSISDPDSGNISYAYNGFGELRFQKWQPGTTNEKTMEILYDGLGRKEQRIDTLPDGGQESYRWEWDYPYVGVLSAAYREQDRFGKFYTYNTKAQVSGLGLLEDSASPRFTYQYDAFGRVSRINYPLNKLSVDRKYHALGQHAKTVNVQTQQPIWALGNLMDSRGNFTQQRYGNGVITQNTFHSQLGSIEKIESGKSGVTYPIQETSYTFDGIGNLHQRVLNRRTSSTNLNRTETFEYDEIDRLIGNGENASFSPCGKNYCYDDLGNLTYKSDVGVFAYNQVNGAGVHGITQGAGMTYHYDAYGNMIQRGTDTLDYNVFNKPTRIGWSLFTYGADHELLKQTSYENWTETYYLNGLYGEKFESLSNGKERHYVDGVMLQETNTANTAATTHYLHYDHLGSVDMITDANGNVKDQLSFNAWGERRQGDWAPGDPTMGTAFFYNTQTGFTGHEMMDHLSLVHMGGRVYDPVISRFLSADIYVQAPGNSQSYNRYSYTFNNPLSFTDSSGYSSSKYESMEQSLKNANAEEAAARQDQYDEVMSQQGVRHDFGAYGVGSIEWIMQDLLQQMGGGGSDNACGSTVSCSWVAGYTSGTLYASPMQKPPSIFVPVTVVSKQSSSTASGPLSLGEVQGLIKQNNKSGQSNALILALIWKESSFNPRAKNRDPDSSATGLMQMTIAATQDVKVKHSDMTDPIKNIQAGTSYLALRIIWAGGDVSRGLNGYGTGPGYSDGLFAAERDIIADPDNIMDALYLIHK